MKKGFLCGPSPTKKDTKTEEKKTENVESSKATGAIPKTSSNAAPVQGKRRRRTRSMGASLSPSPGRGFFVPGFTNNSSSSMSLSELMDASKGVHGLTNMALAHEIAVDKNFELSKIKPENDLEKQIKEVMQRAFWDILKGQRGVSATSVSSTSSPTSSRESLYHLQNQQVNKSSYLSLFHIISSLSGPFAFHLIYSI